MVEVWSLEVFQWPCVEDPVVEVQVVVAGLVVVECWVVVEVWVVVVGLVVVIAPMETLLAPAPLLVGCC